MAYAKAYFVDTDNHIERECEVYVATGEVVESFNADTVILPSAKFTTLPPAPDDLYMSPPEPKIPLNSNVGGMAVVYSVPLVFNGEAEFPFGGTCKDYAVLSVTPTVEKLLINGEEYKDETGVCNTLVLTESFKILPKQKLGIFNRILVTIGYKSNVDEDPTNSGAKYFTPICTFNIILKPNFEVKAKYKVKEIYIPG